MDRGYFLHINGQQVGPLSLEEARKQPIRSSTLVWYEGLTGWVAASALDEFNDLIATAAPVPPVVPSAAVHATVQTLDAPPLTAQSSVAHAPIPGWSSDRILADEIDKNHRLMIVFFICAMVSLFVAAALWVASYDDMGAGILGYGAAGLATFIALVFVVLHVVCFCKFHYRCWAVANARTGSTNTSPELAVGLLFIPCFSIYWYFRSYLELSRLLAKAIQPGEHDLAYRPNESTANTLCILNVFSIIPYLGGLAGLGVMVLWFIAMGENKRAATHLLRTTRAQFENVFAGQ